MLAALVFEHFLAVLLSVTDQTVQDRPGDCALGKHTSILLQVVLAKALAHSQCNNAATMLPIYAPFAINLSCGVWNVRVVALKTTQCDKLLQDWVAFVDGKHKFTVLYTSDALLLPRAVTVLLSVLL